MELFQETEMSTIARIHFNEHGITKSGILAKWYLDKAKGKVDTLKNPILRREVVSVLNKIQLDCDMLLSYQEKLDTFKGRQTKGIIEKVSKGIVILLSQGNISHLHSGISHQLRNIHSELSSMLNSLDTKNHN